MELKENHNGCLSRTFGRINPYRSVLIFCRKQEAPLFSRCQCPLKHRRSCLESRYGKDWLNQSRCEAVVEAVALTWGIEEGWTIIRCGNCPNRPNLYHVLFILHSLCFAAKRTLSGPNLHISFSITINKVALKASFLRTALHHAAGVRNRSLLRLVAARFSLIQSPKSSRASH